MENIVDIFGKYHWYFHWYFHWYRVIWMQVSWLSKLVILGLIYVILCDISSKYHDIAWYLLKLCEILMIFTWYYMIYRYHHYITDMRKYHFTCGRYSIRYHKISVFWCWYLRGWAAWNIVWRRRNITQISRKYHCPANISRYIGWYISSYITVISCDIAYQGGDRSDKYHEISANITRISPDMWVEWYTRVPQISRISRISRNIISIFIKYHEYITVIFGRKRLWYTGDISHPAGK